MKPLIHLLSAAMLVPLAISHAAESPKKPNVIFVLTDDQGWNDAHFAGHPYVKTPNLDRLASQSTWFRQFYVAATVCSPSRCAFMTGHFPSRHFIHGHIADEASNATRSMPNFLDPAVATLPKLLRANGYATAHFGKWHLGHGQGAPLPSEYGIDVSKTVVSNDTAFDEARKDPYFWAKSTGLIVDEAIRFIREHKGQPFYLNVWTLLPHAPLKPTPEQLKVYESLQPKADDPGFGPWMRKYLGEAKDLKSQMQVFCASLTNLDTELGRLFAALDELKLADNTIVFYSSDNGAEDYRIGNAANAGVGNTGPLRARKRSMYEGGVRTFGLVRWPGHVAAGRVDETSVVSGVDFLPTICKLTGTSLPASVQPDGEDMSDIWLGNSRPRTKSLHWEWLFRVWGDDYLPPMLSIRDGEWKLFVAHDGSHAQLFNIPKDISEEHDVAAAHPEIVQSLTSKALAWAKSLPASPVRDKATQTGLPQDGSNPKPMSKKAALERVEMFKKKDANHDGKLTLEEYLDRFPDQAEGRRRFPTFDSNHDGILSEEEFVTMGRK